jgi:FAD/FMN-containing dehydrogenase
MAGTDAGAGTILGWVNDTPISTSIYDWNDSMVLTLSKGNNENDLRNRVLVYGTEGVFAEAKYESTPYFKWKTAVFAAPDLIDTIDIARKTANYNLALLNKLTETISATVEGNSNLMPFKTVMVNSSNYGMSGEYYIYSVNHDFGKDGYTTKLELRK